MHKITLETASTGGGWKVVEREYISESTLTKRNRQYFYGDDARDRAEQRADDLVEKLEDIRDCPVGREEQ